MEFKIDLTKEIVAAKDAAIRDLKERVNRIPRRLANELLRDDSYVGIPSGVIYDEIKRKVDDYCVSEKFDQLVDRIIEEEVEIETRKALKTLLNSRARKVLFTAIPDLTKD